MSEAQKPDHEGRDIVDAHHHIWDPVRNYHPWLRDEPLIPFRYGNYRPIRRIYLPDDFRRDAAPWKIVASVYVETEWDRRDEIGEMDYLATVMAKSNLPSVAVAHATLDAVTAPAVLDSHASRSFVRGIRHKPKANASAHEASPGGMTDALWRKNFAHLVKLGLRYDVQTPWWHFAELAALANAFAEARIIINHTGLPADRSPDAITAWKAAMQTAAACPNIAVKISGLGQRGQPWTADANRDIVRTTIDLFGTERCMFASNFPVDSLCATFAEIYRGFSEIVRDLTSVEQDALFSDNARRIYNIC